MITIRQLLELKGSLVWSIAPDRSVYEALVILAEKNVGALVVVKKGRVVGVFSERDYARNIILQNRKSKQTLVQDIMTQQVTAVRPEQTVDECMALMTDKGIRHLPVLEGDQLVGIVAIGDLVKAIIAEQRARIEQLERYIAP
jgi:CBS domain-containing protein